MVKLKRHMMVHTNERPFPCDLCGKAFRTNYHRLEHRNIHTIASHHVCRACNKTFADSTNFRRHLCLHRRRLAGGGGGSNAVTYCTTSRPRLGPKRSGNSTGLAYRCNVKYTGKFVFILLIFIWFTKVFIFAKFSTVPLYVIVIEKL